MTQKAPAHDTVGRDARMKWWREARFGMFIHYNMFSLWRDPEYAHLEKHPEEHSPAEHDRLRVAKLTPGKAAVQNWARAAKAAGMKYIVLTTKHNGGFCLWDSKVTNFNAVRLGPKRDIIAEFVKACRKNGLKVGFYYALNDRHTGLRDAARKTEAARQGILKYTRGLLRELMTNYGKISILWYDEPCPMGYGGEWDSAAVNRMVRKLQPGIIINDRSLTIQDFTCPEGKIGGTAYPDQDHESCITFNGTWAWNPTPLSKYHTPRSIIDMLRQVTHGGGNLLLNVGPEPATGRIRDIEVERLRTVGKWLAKNGEAIYGPNDRPEGLGESKNNVRGKWTKHGNDAYLWLSRWPSGDVVVKGIRAAVNACSLLATGKRLRYTLKDGVLTIKGLPKACPDKVCGVAVLKIEFASYPR